MGDVDSGEKKVYASAVAAGSMTVYQGKGLGVVINLCFLGGSKNDLFAMHL